MTDIVLYTKGKRNFDCNGHCNKGFILFMVKYKIFSIECKAQEKRKFRFFFSQLKLQ